MDEKDINKKLNARKVILDTSFKKMDADLADKANKEGNDKRIYKVSNILSKSIYEYNFHPRSIYNREDDSAEIKFKIEAEIYQLMLLTFYYFDDLIKVIASQSAKNVLNYNKEVIDEINKLDKTYDVYKEYIKKTEEYAYACTMQNCYKDIENRITALINLIASCDLSKDVEKNPAMVMVNVLDMAIRLLCAYRKVNYIPKSEKVFNINFALKKAIRHFERFDPNMYNEAALDILDKRISKGGINSSKHDGDTVKDYLLIVMENAEKNIGPLSPYKMSDYGHIICIDEDYFRECKEVFINYSLYFAIRDTILTDYLRRNLDIYALLFFPYHLGNIRKNSDIVNSFVYNHNYQMVKKAFTEKKTIQIDNTDCGAIFTIAGNKQPESFFSDIFKRFKQDLENDHNPLCDKIDAESMEKIILDIFTGEYNDKSESEKSSDNINNFLLDHREFIMFFLLYNIGLIEYYAYKEAVENIENEFSNEIKVAEKSQTRKHIDKAIGSVWTRSMLRKDEYDSIEKCLNEESGSESTKLEKILNARILRKKT